MPTYSLKTQAAYLFLGKVIAFVLMAISPMIFVRLLNPLQFGTYRQIIFIMQLAVALIALRIPGSLYYFFPRKSSEIGQLISQTLTLLGTAGCIGSAFFLVLGLVFHVLPSGVTEDYVLPVAVYLFIETVACLVDHIFILEKKPKLVLAATAGNSVIRLFLILGAAILFHAVLAIVYALVLLSLLRLLTIMVYLVRKHTIRPGVFDRVLLREQIKYTAPLAVSNTLDVIGSRIDRGIISGYMSPEDFAVYSIGGLGVMSAVMMLYTSIGKVCLPRFGELAVKGNLEGVRHLWHKMIVMNTMATIPIVCFFCALAVEIITILFTEKYVAAANIWRINMAVLIIKMLGFGHIPTALGKTGAILAGNGVRFIMAVPLSIVLIMKFGLLGGAISFVLGFWANALIQLIAGKKALGATIPTLLPWTRMARIFVISAIPALFLPYLSRLGTHNISTVLIGALVYFPVVGLALILTGSINVEELKGFFRKA